MLQIRLWTILRSFASSNQISKFTSQSWIRSELPEMIHIFTEVAFLCFQIPTTVFTPLEYSTVGLSEEDALMKYGDENIEVVGPCTTLSNCLKILLHDNFVLLFSS